MTPWLLQSLSGFRGLKIGFKYNYFNLMWYKYIDRGNYDPIRIWRKCNLRFNADDNGMMKAKRPGVLFEHLAKAVRSEGPLRGSLFFIFIASVNSYLWYSGEKAKEEAPAKAEKKKLEDDKSDKEARYSLWFNRFNVPSRPNRSIQNFMAFIASEKMLDRAFEYIEYQGTVEAYEDYQKGLDGVASEQDKKMLQYYKESLKHKSKH